MGLSTFHEPHFEVASLASRFATAIGQTESTLPLNVLLRLLINKLCDGVTPKCSSLSVLLRPVDETPNAVVNETFVYAERQGATQNKELCAVVRYTCCR